VDTGDVGGRDYQLVVRGELGDRFARLFKGMQMERLQGMTIVTGRVGDQAQLVGLIQQAQELGLELVSVEQTQPATSSPTRAASSSARGCSSS
jgi:hypothetical protein